jgi:GDP-4-dehydro-6-deoxy-D-mannose reductase
MRVLITGVTGFAGGHLAETLLAGAGVELYGTSRQGRWPDDLHHLAGAITLLPCDLCDGMAVEAVLRQTLPEQIYHLAGYAHAGSSFRDPDAAWLGNLAATRSLYDAVLRWGNRPRILYVGSGLVYGAPTNPGQAYDESFVLRPDSPYAASKAAADLASYQYSRAPGLDIVRVRPFNHIGPRQSSRYAVAHFAEQIAAIERGRQPPVLQTGNLSPQRDLTDVRDVVRAYVLLMTGGYTGDVYNVCSGEIHSMQAVLDRLLALAQVRVEVRQRADLVRGTEVSVVRGDASRLRRETGWTPRIAFEQTLADTLGFWREGLKEVAS